MGFLYQNDHFSAFFNIMIRIFKKNYVILHLMLLKNIYNLRKQIDNNQGSYYSQTQKEKLYLIKFIY